MRNDGRIERHVPWGDKGCIAKTEEVISLIYHTVLIIEARPAEDQ